MNKIWLLPVFLFVMAGCDSDKQEFHDGYGKDAFLKSYSKADTGPANLDYRDGILYWKTAAQMTGTLPKKVALAALFFDKNDNQIYRSEPKGFPKVLAPGENVAVEGELKVSKEEAVNIASWKLELKFID